jgi:putative ATP-dependent endonuclease of the OLD family
MLAQAKDVRHMKVYRLNIRGFRGFETLEINPSEHVMLAGEPRAGRTTVTDAMTRCLDPDSTRRTVDPWDFHDRDLDRRIDIELTLGELGDDLEQRFGDYLEVFDRANRELVAFAENPEALDSDTHEWALRVVWRAQWDSDEGVGTSWLDYPKVSDPDRGRAVRVTRSDRQALPFLAVTRSRPLAIRTEGAFRRLLNAYADTAALSAAVDTLAEEIETAAAVFSADATVVTALEKVLEPLRATLDLEAPAQDVGRFAPEGGTLTGLLSSLAPVLNLGSPDLLLPLERHGSTLSALLSAAELQLLPAAETVVVIDDFGDQLDSASAEYLAATIRRAAGQAWISTRRPDVGRAFNPGSWSG